ncbi:hypothetical protein SAMN05660748_0977 [Blastococcus aggregatus]|uniref:Uncharacterized protein n=2 Tax=Blastococcus aggregatus TaxID=38502 RepID=A0A285V5D5_9ACTN|nr:hypothetical protein SAMN05660748_0977 [Blastococcus aggregatus]
MRYRVVTQDGQEAGAFLAADDDLAAMRRGLPVRDASVRASGGALDPDEYRLEKWVAGAWDFAGRYAFVGTAPTALVA